MIRVEDVIALMSDDQLREVILTLERGIAVVDRDLTSGAIDEDRWDEVSERNDRVQEAYELLAAVYWPEEARPATLRTLRVMIPE